MATAQELERLVIKLVGDGSHYAQTLKQAVTQTETAAQKIERIGRRTQAMLRTTGAGMQRFGRKMTTMLTVPITGFGVASLVAFGKFDQAMTESTSIMTGLTGEQMERMRQQALALGRESVQGPTKLAESYFFLASAGLDAEQAMAALPTVTSFATAGAFDMAQATDLLTDAQSALGMTVDDAAQNMTNMTRVSDVLVKANTLANASVEQFSTSLTSKAGASLKVFNKDVEEGVAVLAAYADQGVKAELSGNALDRVLRLLSKSALDNAEEHQRLGFSVFDANGEMRNMADIVQNLEQVLKGMSTEQKVATLTTLGFEARVQQVILPLLGTSDAIRTYEKELRKAAGTTDEVTNKQLKSFGNQLKITWNMIVTVGIKIGEILAPAVLKMNEWLRMAIDAWDRLSPGVQKAIVFIGAAVAVIGPVLTVIGGLVAVAGAAAGGFATLVAIGGPMLIILAKVAAITAIIVGGITALVAGFVLLTKKFIDYPGILKGMLASTKEFAMGALGFFMNLQENVGILVEWIANNWSEVLARLPAAFLEVAGNMLAALVNNLRVAWRVGMELTAVALRVIINLFKKAWDWVWNGGLVNFAVKGFKKVVEIANKTAWKIATAMFSGESITDSFLDEFKNAEEPITEQIGRIMADGMKDLEIPSLIPSGTFADMEGPKFNLAIGKEPAIKGMDEIEKKTNDVAAATEQAGNKANEAEQQYKSWQLALAGTTQFNATMEGLSFGALSAGNTGALQAEGRAQGESSSFIGSMKDQLGQKADLIIGFLEQLAEAAQVERQKIPPEQQSEDA